MMKDEEMNHLCSKSFSSSQKILSQRMEIFRPSMEKSRTQLQTKTRLGFSLGDLEERSEKIRKGCTKPQKVRKQRENFFEVWRKF